MSAAANSQTRVCPECGTVNNAQSLFCAECGASLSTTRTDVSDQTTTTFSPVASTPVYTETTTTQSYAPVQPDMRIPIPDDRAYVADPVRPHAAESIRGFWLGFIASLLMVMIVGFYIWSTLMSDSTRDKFLNLFS